MARPLGAWALADRLGEARHADAVVLGAAGTANPSGVAGADADVVSPAHDALARPIRPVGGGR